jgi:hypothetical protein
MSNTTTTLGRVGIDKSNLTTRDYRLTDSLRFNHKPPTRLAVDPTSLDTTNDLGSIPWGVDSHGRELTGKYFITTPNGLNVDLSSMGLLINLNPSRVITPDPTYLVTSKQDLITTREHVQRELDSLGIEVDVLSMNVCRLDPSKQVNTVDLACRYQSVGSMISATRVKNRQYDTAFMLGNTQRQFMFYSKHEHMRHYKIDSNNPHLGRGELRLLNAKIVRNTFGISNFQDLIELDPEQLSCEFHNMVDSFVFSNRLDPDSLIQVNYENEKTLIESNYAHQRNGIEKYKSDLGIRFVLDNFGSVSNFAKMLSEIDSVPRSTRYRIVSKMKTQVERISFIDNRRQTQTTLDKYNELHRNFGLAV